MQKIHALLGLFILLLIVLVINPRVINDANNTILGRIMIIGFILFLTVHNTTLGLLAALCLIIAVNMFFMEGFTENNTKKMDKVIEKMENNTTTPVNDVTNTVTDITDTPMSDTVVSDDKKAVDMVNINTQPAHEAIQSVDSNAISVSKDNFVSNQVESLDPSVQGFALLHS